jgi:hypothetical protein
VDIVLSEEVAVLLDTILLAKAIDAVRPHPAPVREIEFEFFDALTKAINEMNTKLQGEKGERGGGRA